jgi:2-phosphosulfolactate phosphatase
MKHQKSIEVVFSPDLYKYYQNPEAIVVVVDVLRATSAICAAFESGVAKMIPVPDLEKAKELKDKGYIVAAERDGNVLDFADFGNSPFNFTPSRVKGKTVAYSTTNGTRAIQLASESYSVVIASFINMSAVVEHLVNEKHDVVILCAGWKGKFCLEDTLLAGAMAEKLLDNQIFYSACDSVTASLDLWKLAKNDIMYYIEKATQRQRLKRLGLDDVMEYCHTPDSSAVVPVFEKGVLVAWHNMIKK